jgi:hypothetical protein
MAILAAGENQLSAIYFGSNTQGRKFAARKVAIMCEGVHSYDRGKLHFCLQGTNHTDYQNVGISDSRMVIQHDGKVGIGTTSPAADAKLHINASNANNLRLTTLGHPNYPNLQTNFTYGANHIDVYNSSSTKGFGSTGDGYMMYLNFYSGAGVVLTSGSPVSSDDRLKHNEKIITNGLDIINQLEPKKYFKSLKRYDEEHNYELDGDGKPITDDFYRTETGLIAQQVMTIDDLKYTVDEVEDKNEIYEEEKVDENGDVVVDEEGNPVMEERERLSLKGRYIVNYQDIFVYNIAATK